MKNLADTFQAALNNPEVIKRAAAALVTGFVSGRQVLAGADGLTKTAAAASSLMPQAETMVRQALALRVGLFSPPAAA